MLRSSLGFHTTSLFLRLTRDEAEQLIKHFCNYRKRTRLVRMLMPKNLPGGKKEWREYIPVYIYDGTTFLSPSELKISYFDKHKDRGIK